MKKNLQKLNATSPAPFSDDIIINYRDYLRIKGIALFPHYEKIVKDIPLGKVIGIDQGYGGMTWGDCLNGKHLKRIRRNLQYLEENPGYYLSDTEKSYLSFTKIGNEYFINTGKHRVVIARFLEHFNPHVFQNRSPLRNVEVNEYFLDYEYMSIQSSIKELEKNYSELCFILTYTDKANKACLTVSRTDSCGRSEIYTRSEASDCIMKLKNPNIFYKIISEKTHNLLNYKECLTSLKKSIEGWYSS